MIYLEQGQKLFDRPELVVYEATGERADTDMVICAKAENPSEPFCWLEAQYIAYGGVVYKISDNKELEAEILKTDPDSTINDVVANPVSDTANATTSQNPLDVVIPPADPAYELNASAINQTQQLSAGDTVSATQTQTNQPTASSTSATESAPTVISTSTDTILNIDTSNASSTTVSSSTDAVIDKVIDKAIDAVIPAPTTDEATSSVAEPIVSAIRRKIKKSLS